MKWYLATITIFVISSLLAAACAPVRQDAQKNIGIVPTPLLTNRRTNAESKEDVQVLSTPAPTSPEPAGEPSQQERSVPEDPTDWSLVEGEVDPDDPERMIYSLSEDQKRMALKPVREFFNLMYHASGLLTPERARLYIDTTSQAWTDPEMGFQASYDSFAEAGYFPYYEFPIDDPDHYTGWQVLGVRKPEGTLTVEANFRMEEQGFVVFEQATRKPVVSTTFWGPLSITFHTGYIDGKWMIIYRSEIDLGTKTMPTTGN